MTLEDFEKSLADAKRAEEGEKGERSRRRHKDHHHRHHRSHHRDDDDDGHRHKRRRRSRDRDDDDREHRRHRHRRDHGSLHRDRSPREQKASKEHDEEADPTSSIEPPKQDLTRDSWMEAPSALDVDYIHRRQEKVPEATTTRSSKADYELKIHENELNKHHLESLRDGGDTDSANIEVKPSQHEVDYTFGDAGASWRMMKLKSVYRKAEETGDPVEEIAMKQYGELRSFDDAREEEMELDRREMYGKDYVGKEKPSGELYQERKLKMGIRRENSRHYDEEDESEEERTPEIREVPSEDPKPVAPGVDQTTLNKLRAQMMKAKLKGSADAARLEAEYNAAANNYVPREASDVVVLGAMENRMLTGGRKGEVKSINNKRGRERGLVEENEEMSIEDMVREERRTRGQVGGEGQRFAERIAKDAKFDNDLEYMDENASKLAKRVQKSEINLKNAAVSEFQKLNRILDNCPLCHHEDTSTPPLAPVVSLATRTYLTLATEPEISPGSTLIVPIQHRKNLLECDDDEWEEIRNFMKSLTRHHAAQSRSVLFYENAAFPHRHPHAAMHAIPLPSAGDLDAAPAFFREAILSSAPEWSQHRKLIDTLAASRQPGMGRAAFRRSIAKEAPYFHAWFGLDGGLGHVVEDGQSWPKGDLFAREVIGAIVGVDGTIVRKMGRWERGKDAKRAEVFRKKWSEWDWTKMLVEEGG